MPIRADMKFKFYRTLFSNKTLKTLTCSLGIIAGCATIPTTNAQLPPASLEDRASRYIEFRQDLDTIDQTAINSADATRSTLHLLSSHDAEELSSGWMAYAAMVAADTPEFAASIQQHMKKKKTREAFLNNLCTNPVSVRELEGAQAAREAILRIAAQDAIKIQGLGDRYTQKAYAIQNQSWARKKLPSDGTARLSDAENFRYSKARMAAPYVPAVEDQGVRQPSLASYDPLWAPSWNDASTSYSPHPRSTPIMDRVLVLAARYAVNELPEPVVNGYAKSEKARKCHKNADLNLKACISATRTATEEVFCLGKHGLTEVSSCVGWIANVSAN